MTRSERSPAADYDALLLACEAFASATHHYRVKPLSLVARKRAHPAAEPDGRADAWLSFDVAGRRFEMPVAITTGTISMGTNVVANRVLSGGTLFEGRRLMLVTQYVTPKLAETLIAQRIPFLDTAGNVFLEEPEATIMIVGRPKPAHQPPAQTSRSTTPKGLRVTFALLTHPGLVQAPYRTIAEHSAVALNTVNMAMDDLLTRGLVVQKADGRTIADRRRLIEDWVSLYPTRLRPKLSPRRYSSMSKEKNWWSAEAMLGFDARFGGEVAAEMLTHELKPASVTLYTHAGVSSKLMAKGLLRPDERGTVEILEAFWPEDAEKAWPSFRRALVHPLLIYTDLITSLDDRNRGAAKTIYDRYLADERA